MRTSDSINDLASALAQAQAEMKPASIDATNPHFRSRYATLASVWEAARPVLSKHKLAIVQTLEAGEQLALETRLVHASGQWVASSMPLLIDKQTMQGLGSAVSYARRYSIAALIGIVADEDDDGNEASASAPPVKKETVKKLAPVKVKAVEQGSSAQFVPQMGRLAGKALHERTSEELTAWLGGLLKTLGEQNKSLADQPEQVREIAFHVEQVLAERGVKT